MKLVFDIEADNLLPKISKFHCAGAINVDTGEEYWFLPNQLEEFLSLLDKADVIIAHNAYGYDVPALHKLTGWTPKATVQCTKIMSQVLNYRRFGFGHALKQWGEFFRDHKGDYTGGFEEFNNDMFIYMQQDVRLGVKVYKYLIKELQAYIKKHNSKSILQALRSEMELDRIMTEQCENGWQFNVEAAKTLVGDINTKMEEISNYINPLLPTKVTVVDPDTQKEHEPITGKRHAITKTPTYTKTGKLSSHIVKWFGSDMGSTIDDSKILGDYCRLDYIVGDIGNTDTVKSYLGTIGWQPDEWNWKKKNGQFIKVSAKLTDSSLEPLGEAGKALMEYYTLRSRKSILEGWFDYVDKNSRLHGDVFNVGTPTFRQTHKIIANLPSGKATLGPEIRRLFVAKEGYKLVSADSAACQLRLLAHYMNDPDFTKQVLEGDIHQMNADIIGCTRNEAKRFIFAYLYGAGAQKLSGYINKSVEETKKSVAKYKRALPKLVQLVNKCNEAVEKRGYIMGLDSRPIKLSKDERHKALNYLIQGAEAVVMKYTVQMIDKRLREANIDFNHLLFYHDEHTVEVRQEQSWEAKEIIVDCFAEAPKAVGINIMTCGDCKIGDDYYEVH
jgi:DNA polymerase-1